MVSADTSRVDGIYFSQLTLPEAFFRILMVVLECNSKAIGKVILTIDYIYIELEICRNTFYPIFFYSPPSPISRYNKLLEEGAL